MTRSGAGCARSADTSRQVVGSTVSGVTQRVCGSVTMSSNSPRPGRLTAVHGETALALKLDAGGDPSFADRDPGGTCHSPSDLGFGCGTGHAQGVARGIQRRDVRGRRCPPIKRRGRTCRGGPWRARPDDRAADSAGQATSSSQSLAVSPGPGSRHHGERAPAHHPVDDALLGSDPLSTTCSRVPCDVFDLLETLEQIKELARDD